MFTSPSSSDAALNDKQAAGFASLHIITAACHAVLNTQFIPPSKKPSWFDDLQNALDEAKVPAKAWVDDIAPELSASIPGHVIDYGTTYAAMSEEIIALLDKNPHAKGKDDPDVRAAIDLVRTLHDEVERIVGEVAGAEEVLKTWGHAMQAAHDALFDGASNIEKAEAELSKDILDLKEAIGNLQQKIKENNIAAGLSAGGVALGILAIAAGVIVTIATLGTGVGAGVALIAVGVGVTAGAATSWGVFGSMAAEAFKDIELDNLKIKEDEAQLLALHGLSLAAGSAVDAIALATGALSDLKFQWKVFHKELAGTVSKLEQAENEELQALVNKALVKAAAREWEAAVHFAEQIAGLEIGVQTKQLAVA